MEEQDTRHAEYMEALGIQCVEYREEMLLHDREACQH
jgi:hypothetical protein